MPAALITDEEVLEAVHTALENDDRLYLCGGVRPRHAAKYCQVVPATLRDRLRMLVKKDALVEAWGYDADQPGYPARQGYLPIDHPDATSPYTLHIDDS